MKHLNEKYTVVSSVLLKSSSTTVKYKSGLKSRNSILAKSKICCGHKKLYQQNGFQIYHLIEKFSKQNNF